MFTVFIFSEFTCPTNKLSFPCWGMIKCSEYDKMFWLWLRSDPSCQTSAPALSETRSNFWRKRERNKRWLSDTDNGDQINMAWSWSCPRFGFIKKCLGCPSTALAFCIWRITFILIPFLSKVNVISTGILFHYSGRWEVTLPLLWWCNNVIMYCNHPQPIFQ